MYFHKGFARVEVYINVIIMGRVFINQALVCLFFTTCFLSNAQRACYSVAHTYSSESSISLRSNLASWLILTPSIGAEYKSTDRLGLILDTSWIQLDLENTKYKYWRMWNVSPQLRYYLGRNLNYYMGAQYSVGGYNVSGKLGNYMGGGLTTGHQFYIGRNLLFDLGVSLGYLNFYNTIRFKRIEGVNYQVSEKYSSSHYGLTGVSMSLVWKIR